MSELNKIKNIKNIKFEYADHVLPDAERERFMTGQANLWLEPLIDQFNEEDAVVNFFLKERGENRVHFTGMSNELEVKVNERWKLFQIPRPE